MHIRNGYVSCVSDLHYSQFFSITCIHCLFFNFSSQDPKSYQLRGVEPHPISLLLSTLTLV
jgi:hypothetical protein